MTYGYYFRYFTKLSTCLTDNRSFSSQLNIIGLCHCGCELCGRLILLLHLLSIVVDIFKEVIRAKVKSSKKSKTIEH